MMILPLMCGECLQESISKDCAPIDELLVPVSELKDDPIYDVTCANGHSTKCIVMNEKFELLFDLGYNAIIDGYYREAASSFAASLERFHEFYLRMELEQNLGSDKFESAWKLVKNQSERQYGAYLFLYLDRIKSEPAILPESDTSFRNKVIHKGYMPNREEVLKFGEKIRSIITGSMKKMHESGGDELIEKFEQRFKSLGDKFQVKYGCTVTPILDFRQGGKFGDGDIRNNSMVQMMPITIANRNPQRMTLHNTVRQQ